MLSEKAKYTNSFSPEVLINGASCWKFLLDKLVFDPSWIISNKIKDCFGIKDYCQNTVSSNKIKWKYLPRMKTTNEKINWIHFKDWKTFGCSRYVTILICKNKEAKRSCIYIKIFFYKWINEIMNGWMDLKFLNGARWFLKF